MKNLLTLGVNLLPAPLHGAETTTLSAPNMLSIATDQLSADAVSCRIGKVRATLRQAGLEGNHVIIQNLLAQTGEIDGMNPTMEGRMVRSDRYKYCVYSRGQQRESLVDLQTDPGETNDLAADPKYRKVLVEHRTLLARFGVEQNDPLVADLLTDDIPPLPFTVRKTNGEK